MNSNLLLTDGLLAGFHGERSAMPTMKITENTTVALPLKVAIPALLCFTGAMWLGASTLEKINAKLDVIITRSEMEVWALKLQRNNPTISVPEIPERAKGDAKMAQKK
jgi:hypothetical protein